MAVRIQDLGEAPLAALARSPLVAGLDDRERERLLRAADRVRFEAQAPIGAEALHVVLDGAATLRRERLPLRRLGPGDHFGELAFLGHPAAGDAVHAETAVLAARLAAARWAELAREEPALALKVAIAVASSLGRELELLTGDMGMLLRGRSLPRAE